MDGRSLCFIGIGLVMLWVLAGILMDLWNMKLVAERKRLLAIINDMRRQARAEGVEFYPKTEFDVGGGIKFSANDIGMDEEHIRAQVENSIAEGRQDPVCRFATDENLRSCILRFHLRHWPRAFVCLRGQAIMLQVFKGHVEEFLPHILQLTISKKKMLERRAF